MESIQFSFYLWVDIYYQLFIIYYLWENNSLQELWTQMKVEFKECIQGTTKIWQVGREVKWTN